MASLVGVLYGDGELQLGKYGTKSIAGVLGCCLMCFCVGLFEGMPLGFSLVLGLIGAFAEVVTVVLPVPFANRSQNLPLCVDPFFAC